MVTRSIVDWKWKFTGRNMLRINNSLLPTVSIFTVVIFVKLIGTFRYKPKAMFCVFRFVVRC
jgi:hypothetical protein